MNGEIGDTSAKQFGNPAPRRASDAIQKYLGSPRSQVDYVKLLAALLHSMNDYLQVHLWYLLGESEHPSLSGEMSRSLAELNYCKQPASASYFPKRDDVIAAYECSCAISLNCSDCHINRIRIRIELLVPDMAGVLIIDDFKGPTRVRLEAVYADSEREAVYDNLGTFAGCH